MANDCIMSTVGMKSLAVHKVRLDPEVESCVGQSYMRQCYLETYISTINLATYFTHHRLMA